MISANLGKADGIICTGYTTTVAAVQVLKELSEKTPGKKIALAGIDDDPVVLDAIRSGAINGGTIAQNPKGMGYIGCALLRMLEDGSAEEGCVFHQLRNGIRDERQRRLLQARSRWGHQIDSRFA